MITLSELNSDPLGPRTCGITDDDINRMAREELAKIVTPVTANRKKAIVWFAPVRKEGVIETAWDFTDNSVEAVVVHDNTGYGLTKGTRVMAHPRNGRYFEHDGVKLCVVDADALLLVEET